MTMDVISRNTSTLNPNAPMFIPSAYRTVEDFSDQWWALVHSSPWFRDYWLRECFQDPQNDDDDDDDYNDAFFPENDDPLLLDILGDIEALIDSQTIKQEEDRENRGDLISIGSLKWRKQRLMPETPRYSEKAPKFVNVKVNPRPIQQPR